MNKYLIASLVVAMNPKGNRLAESSLPYMTVTDKNPDIKIEVSSSFLLKKKEQYPQLSLQSLEYMYYGSAFYEQLLDFNGFVLHASAVGLNGEAYLFSAKSGVGKSTHTELWKKRFGERAVIINDDKPAVRMENDRYFVYGTPWSGKTNRNTNIVFPLKAIAFIERAEDNRIIRITAKQAVKLLLEQTLRPKSRVDKLLFLMDKLLNRIPVYKLCCNMDVQAAECAYNGMKG